MQILGMSAYSRLYVLLAHVCGHVVSQKDLSKDGYVRGWSPQLSKLELPNAI